MTYSSSEEFATLCGKLETFIVYYFFISQLDLLGERLEDDGKDGCYDNAALCYICSGNINKFTECWLVHHVTYHVTNHMTL